MERIITSIKGHVKIAYNKFVSNLAKQEDTTSLALCQFTISEFKRFIPSKILSEIKKYPKTAYKEDFELSILNAMDRILNPNR